MQCNESYVYYIIRFTSLCKIFTYLSVQQKIFGAMCTINQYLAGLVVLAVIVFTFQFIWVGMTEVLVWLTCVIVSKSVRVL